PQCSSLLQHRVCYRSGWQHRRGLAARLTAGTHGPLPCGRIFLQRGGTNMDQERRSFLQDTARLGGFALASAALWRIEPVLAPSGRGHELGTMTIVELSQLLASKESPAASSSNRRSRQSKTRKVKVRAPSSVYMRANRSPPPTRWTRNGVVARSCQHSLASRFRSKICSMKPASRRLAARKCWSARRQLHATQASSND